MALICDTSGVYAIHDADDAEHLAAKAVVETEPGPLLLPVVLVAEIDYLLTNRLGTDAAVDFLSSIQHGAFSLVMPLAEDIDRWRELVIQYRDLQSVSLTLPSSPPPSALEFSGC